MRNNLLAIATGALLMVATSSANALVLNLTSGLAEGTYSSISYLGGNLTVTADGFSCCVGSNYDVYVDQTSPPGLGVWTGNGDLDDIDGWGDESLIFDFTHAIRLLGIRFVDGDHDYDFDESNDSDDTFDLLMGGLTILDEFAIENADTDGWIDLSSLNLVGANFQIGADDGCDDNREGKKCKDSFYVAKIKFERVPVPEPTTLGMLGLGLVAFGIKTARRRRA